jgi:hypothetical protein
MAFAVARQTFASGPLPSDARGAIKISSGSPLPPHEQVDLPTESVPPQLAQYHIVRPPIAFISLYLLCPQHPARAAGSLSPR